MDQDRREALYRDASRTHGAALERLARGWERDAEKRRDLVQEIHVALWRSLAAFDGRCSLATWTFRVAHNVAASHARRAASVRPLATIDEVASLPADDDLEAEVGRKTAVERLLSLVYRLTPLDRQVMLLWLEGLDAASIGEISGLSAANVATKVHRMKDALARRFREGGRS